MGKLDGKIAVVTGAGSGIGKATALDLAACGARVHLVDIDDNRLAGAREACERLGARATSHCLDCTDAAAVTALAETIFAAEGRVDLLQNGVGVLVAAPVEALTEETWRKTIDANLFSVVHAVSAFVPKMLCQGGELSHVINIASFAGLVGFPYTLPYSTSKFAVVGLSEALGAEVFGRGICVTAVCPGMVRSNLVADGTLELPGAWRQVVRRAFDILAAPPERIADSLLRAAQRKRPLVVPAIFLPPLWFAKRAAGEGYLRVVRRLAGQLRRLGQMAEGGR